MTFDLTILGCGSALPTSKRYSTAQVLRVHERFFLIDCGEGTQILLRKNKIKFGKINHIFISHIHGDHIFGLFGILSTFNLLGRKVPLTLYGDAQLQSIVDFFIKTFSEEIDYEIKIKVLSERKFQKVHEDKMVEVFAFPLKHRINTFGYLFREKKRQRNIRKEIISDIPLSIKNILDLKEGKDVVDKEGVTRKYEDLTIDSHQPRSYAYCSDTAYYPKITKYVNEVDLLFHESTFLQEDVGLAKQTGHSTAKQAAQIAQQANVKQLVLGHYSSRYTDESKFLEEAAQVFPNTIAAEDGMNIKVPLK
ncbi:MAG: ribonuclease Z [Bacteroidales bacterium]|nr:ribonuclease Z [Bacteroidales bacterium]